MTEGDIQISPDIIEPCNWSIKDVIFNLFNDKQYQIVGVVETKDFDHQVLLRELSEDERCKSEFLDGRFYLDH